VELKKKNPSHPEAGGPREVGRILRSLLHIGRNYGKMEVEKELE